MLAIWGKVIVKGTLPWGYREWKSMGCIYLGSYYVSLHNTQLP